MDLMLRDAFPIHAGLHDSTRFPSLSQRTSEPDRAQIGEVVWLVAMGVGAGAITSVWDFQLKLPGHAILRSVPLIALGLATVPRRNAGWLLGASAALGVTGMALAGGPSPGIGAGTSLLLIGPVLEVALRRAGSGKQVYGSFVLAGLVSNLAAFVARALPKLFGMEAPRGKSLSAWAPSALVSYALCGILAGLLSAMICFRVRSRSVPAESTS
jgi:hypothetical protein